MNRHFFIKTAIKHAGALHKSLGISPKKKIPLSTLHAAAKRGGLIAKRANLALTLRKFH